ncbi:MAG: leucine-rich repeat protein [Clostridia bacterium]|nr:leucine-rich repeat protein [Clostridia bacterium]
MKKTVAILLALLFALQIAFVPAAAEGEGGADVPEFTTIGNITSFILEKMVARNTEIRYKTQSALYALIGASLNSICKHTGNGAEGDYLRLALNYVMPQPEKGVDGVYTLHPVYYTTAEQEAAVDAYVETVVAGCTAQDDTEIAQYLYDYLCEHVTFDLENLYNDADLLKYTAYGAAVNGRAVCQGFAQLYYKLALAAGLDCRIVTGTRGNEAHAWNIIQIDDLWYHVDASSGAQLLDNSAYFMKRLFDGYTISYGEKTAAEIQGYSFVLGNADETLITGTLTDTVSYVLNKTTGDLVVSGTGVTMKNGKLCDKLPSDVNAALIKTAVFEEGITSISTNFFYQCTNLSQVSLSSTVAEIKQGVFADCAVKADSIYVSDANPYILLCDGCLIEKSSKTLIRGSDHAAIPKDGSIETVGYGAFKNCKALTEACIPASVKTISTHAFVNCINLQTLTFDNRSNKEYDIGELSFGYCKQLTEIKLPRGLKSLGSAFSHCTELRRVSLPNTVTSISDYVFNYCGKLESITMPSGNEKYCVKNNCLIDIQKGKLIAGCSNSVIPSDGSVTQISSSGYGEGYAFNGCTELKSLVIPEGVTKVCGFDGCTGLTEIVFPNSVMEIYGFNDCSNLSSVTLPNQLTKIFGFQNCPSLKSVNFPNTLRVIGTERAVSFSGCTSLTDVEIPASVEVIYAFNNCPGLTSVTIPSKCGVIKGFDNCENLIEFIVLSKKFSLFYLNDSQFRPDCTIYGFAGSYIETWAKRNHYAFVDLCPLTNEPHNAQVVDATEPDCLNPGYTAGTVCADCGEWLSGHEIHADALGHDPGDPAPENVVAATCTAEGTYDNVTRCTRCGEVLASTPEKLAMAPHADEDHNGYCDDCGAYICEHPETTLQNDRAPACLEAGYTGDTVCTWCGATVTYGVTVPATGHSPAISSPALDATCLDTGLTAEYACTVCGDVTTAAQPVPLAAHKDLDGDGLCDLCLAPTDCTQYGRCGDALFWYVDNGNLVISGSGASGDLAAAPWESCTEQIDCVYLRDGVTAMDGARFAVCPGLAWVFAPAGATVSSCNAPVLYYSNENGVVTVSGRDGVPAMDLPALLNAASVLCTDRTVSNLCFDRLSLLATDGGDEVVYDILKNGKIVDENHFRLPSGTLLQAFSMKPLSYPSFNSAFAAIAENPDRTLILSLSCTDLLPDALKADSQSYTEQFVLHFVDEPQKPDEPQHPGEPQSPKPEQSPFQKIAERFQATLAAILSVFKKLFKLFKR